MYKAEVELSSGATIKTKMTAEEILKEMEQIVVPTMLFPSRHGSKKWQHVVKSQIARVIEL